MSYDYDKEREDNKESDGAIVLIVATSALGPTGSSRHTFWWR